MVDLLRTPLAHRKASSLAELLRLRAEDGSPSLSFEFFPPKDDAGLERLWLTFDRLLELAPDFVSVTYGAGGSNREKSFAIVERMAPEVLTIGHLTAVGATKDSTREIISRYRAAGVTTILALRGDPPKDQPDALERGELKTALELVQLAKDEFSLEVGVAAFPEIHPESPSLEHDAKVLRLKQDAGASFAMTQLFFTLEAYLRLIETNERFGVQFPVLPGLMPIANAKNVIRMAQLSGAAIPQPLLSQLESAPSEEAARAIGMEYSMQLGLQLLEAGAPGLHIFSLNHDVAAIELARGVGLAS